eukprot:TRINITY_DN576_c1_g2_i1.p1 TRINITY_DN576_c1_g2~~TRINITY_DN576_c1_g2_i1.p1  ORF type:complete len:505 (+),score=176.45 TRINITY_DN576_c1_g2_i1:58-1515(+)
MKFLILFVFSLFIVNIYCTTSMQDALITNLPNLSFTPNFKQYAGYVTVDQTKELFYWFVESQNDPTNDPVVLWLQGGPGCSSVGDGLLQEHGPFLTEILSSNQNGMNVGLRPNYYSWNKIANVIYLDSPCGVGYSYSTAPGDGDYDNNDNQTASDSFEFLKGFFDVYTDFANNDFWISGESYGGVYVPTLAYHILTNTSAPTLTANLKRGGITLGNPVTNCDTSDYKGTDNMLIKNDNVQMFYWHGMVSYYNFNNWISNGCNTANPSSTSTCNNIYSKIYAGVGRFDQPLARKENLGLQLDSVPNGAINPDCLYYSFCTGNATLEFDSAAVENCFGIDDQISTYLNNQNTLNALHAQIGGLKKQWSECGGVNYRKIVGSLIPYLQQIFDLGPDMGVMYYSGDIDIATVPFPGTIRCLNTLNQKVVEPWRLFTMEKEVAGYVEVYERFQYTMIKGAGHEAPAFQPASCFLMYESFLNNKTLPKGGL